MKRRIQHIFLLVGTFLISLNSLHAQFSVKRTQGNTGYLEYLPPDYYSNPTRKYPLMIFLHGKGERGNGSAADLEKVKRHGPPKEIKNGHNMCFVVDGIEECFIVIAPQLDGSKPSWGIAYIDEVFEHVLNGPDNYRVDPSRIYLTGLSLGGNGVWKYTWSSPNDPNKLAAIAPIAAWGNPNEGCNISAKKVPIWAFHGDSDNTVGYITGLNMFNAVKDCTDPVPTAELIFTTYEGVGHNSWGRAYNTGYTYHQPNLYEWLLSKRLNSGGSPTANAGPDRSITLPTNSITLNGSANDPDGSIIAYSWTKISGGTVSLINENTPNLTLENLEAGTYLFRLTVTDNDGNTASDDVEVLVNGPTNTAPVANAGPDRTITLPQNTLNISGSGSDTDGTIVGYEWALVSGPGGITLTNTTNPVLTVGDLLEGEYIFELTVTDNDGSSASDEMKLTVNPEEANTPPTANAGPDITVSLPSNSTNLTGQGIDSDGTVVSYLWQLISGPSNPMITNSTNATATISDLVTGTYRFSLTVTDNDGDQGVDDVIVYVLAANQAPTANAGPDQIVVLPTSSINTQATASDADGSIASYLWSQTSGPNTASILNTSNPVTTINELVEGIYRFQFTATDDDGASASDELIVTVAPEESNNPPTVDAGDDVYLTLPVNFTQLTASASDTDGSISSYEWSKSSGPSSFDIDNTASSTINITNLEAGTYIFQVVVTDNDGDTASDEVQVNVAANEVNQAPLVSAGPDRDITLPQSSLTLTGSASDPDGTITGIQWTQLSGPVTASLSGENTTNLQVSNLSEGEYIFRIAATDDDGASAEDEMTIRVNAENKPPLADAGPDVNIVLPQNSVTIIGTATDPENEIAVASWVQISGPAANMEVIGAQLNLSDLVEGSYTFEFTVSDTDGLSDSDEMRLVVTAANQLPVVSAGNDVTITLPLSTVNLNGSANDPDGSITSVLWTQVSGNPATLTNPDQLTCTISDLIEGIYRFRISATDDSGDSASDEVVVTVNPEIINQPPVANAGPNIDITLPVNSINITGSGTDPDGAISGYLWEKISGPSAVLTNADQPILQVSQMVSGTYRFRLTVADDQGATGSDEMIVSVNEEIVNQLPTADAGEDVIIQAPLSSVTLFGQGSDPDGTVLVYLWTQITGDPADIADPSKPTVEISNLLPGIYEFNLEVTDEDGASDNDLVKVTVLEEAVNLAPTANAGADIIITLPTNSVILDGSGSDTDGSIDAYNWSIASGPSSINIVEPTNPKTQVTGLVEGIYTLRLRVTDTDGATDEDLMRIIVESEEVNTPPTALAGDDITLKLPVNKATLYGSGFDSDGTIAAYLWSMVSGPSQPELSNTNASTLQMNNLIEGTYVMRLRVEDDGGAVATDEVSVIVLPESANEAPFVNAGNDQVVYLPDNQTTLIGEAFDPDGTITSVRWSKLSGPGATLINPDALETRVEGLQEGIYFFRITAVDDDGAISTDGLRVTVQAEDVNQAPSADAGPDIDIELPENSVTIMGQASDPEDNIASIIWDQTDGPSAIQIENATSLNPTFNMLQEGIYTFRLTVTDSDGLSDSDRMRITVSDISTTAPTIYAGEDIEIYIPAQEALLNAVINDDGYLDTLYWEQVSGENAFISNPNNPRTLIQGLALGSYTFRITGIDNDGLSGSDEVVIRVLSNNTESSYPMKVFTPNGDGDNELWVLDPDVQRYSNCPIRIFNRNGQIVFETQSYLNSWDGTWNGQSVREGVYYFILSCPEDTQSLNGSITIVR